MVQRGDDAQAFRNRLWS